MTAQELMRLADRVERATGADRVLDALICQLVDLPSCIAPDCHPEVLERAIARTLDGSWPHDTDCVPAYSASLDAAMTLVPEGWTYTIGRTWCTLWPVSSELTDEQWPDDWDDDRQHKGRTPALALCAAALRARASSDAGGRG